MKRLIVLFVCTLIVEATMSYANEPTVHTTATTEHGNTSGAKYTFTVYGEIPILKSTFEEKHFLGDALSEKWNTFCNNYTRVYEVSVGLSGSTVEIVKPAVYNAVQKVNKYYKKALKANKVSKEDATRELSHILDCANVICIEDETSTFEQAVSDAKTPERIIDLFHDVELTFL